MGILETGRNDHAGAALTSSGIRVVSDIVELQPAIHGANVKSVQLGPAPFLAEVLEIQLDRSVLNSGHYHGSVRTLGTLLPDCITFFFASVASGEGSMLRGPLEQSAVWLVQLGDRLDATAMPGLHWFAWSVPVETLARWLEALGRDPAAILGLESGGFMPGPRSVPLGELLRQAWVHGARAGPVAALGDLEGRLLGGFVDALDSGPIPDPSKRGRYARIAGLAEACMRESIDQRLSTDELARNCGCSRRYLEGAHRALIGLSPQRYFRYLRLNVAHVLLLEHDASSVTVTEIANRVGHGELGRFAGYYRDMFGEAPNKTLAREAPKSLR